jgi:hypothetical protein
MPHDIQQDAALAEGKNFPDPNLVVHDDDPLSNAINQQLTTKQRVCNKRYDDFSKSNLLKRGWSERVIAELLGDPDKRGRNAYNWGRPISLWTRERVIEAETSPIFVAFQARRQSRPAARRRLADQL